jgi:uncharacterized protein (TIGR02118 family)
MQGIAVEQGLGGAEPGSPAAYSAMGHLLLDSVEAFQTAFGPHAETIMGDIPNYTNSTPTIQISEIKLQRAQSPAPNVRDQAQVVRERTM